MPKQYAPIKKKVMTVQDMQAYLGISKPYAYQMLKIPGFPVYTLPMGNGKNMYRIPIKELDEWLRSNNISD